MALLGNYTVLAKSPGRFIGGVVEAGARSNFNKQGQSRGIYFGQFRFDQFNGTPNGYVPPYSWVIPQIGGGMATYRGIIGTGSAAGGNLAGGLNGTAGLMGSGTINSAAMTLLIYGTAAITGGGSMTAAITAIGNAVSAVTGNAALGANLSGAISASGALTGSGTLSASVVGGIFATACITGSGVLAAQITGLIQALASVSGSGSTTANLNAAGNLTAATTGNSSVTAAITALANLVKTLTGSGTVSSAQATAYASMTASILSYGTLSPENLSATLLATMIENGISVGEALRLMLSVLAGKTDGAGTGTMHFRDLADGKPRITVTLDANGNRTAITRDGTTT